MATKKVGRPKSENSKNTMLRVRIDNDILEKLEKVSIRDSISKSEVVRKGIIAQYNKK